MEKLKNLRLKNGYTYQDMADILNISKSFYWQIENSKRTLSYIMAIKIGKVFHKMPDDIFYDDFKNKD
jgi:putative transcriptional regulator